MECDLCDILEGLVTYGGMCIVTPTMMHFDMQLDVKIVNNAKSIHFLV